MAYTETYFDATDGTVKQRTLTTEEFDAINQVLRTVPASITRRQCAKQLLVLGMISAQEAIDMTQSGKPPAMVQAYLDNMPEPDRTFATIDFAADTYLRSNPLLAALMAANGMTEQQVDEYFIAAAQL